MGSHWDFRKILNVNLENGRCVGRTQKGLGCKNVIKGSDLATAGYVLDRIDHAKLLLDSLDDLESLARLLLCKSYHNPTTRSQSYSQVREMTQKWTDVVIREDERIKRKSAKLLKAQRELTKMNDNIQVMVEAVEEAVVSTIKKLDSPVCPISDTII